MEQRYDGSNKEESSKFLDVDQEMMIWSDNNLPPCPKYSQAPNEKTPSKQYYWVGGCTEYKIFFIKQPLRGVFGQKCM